MAVDRSRLPALGAEPLFAFPEIRRHSLPNGLRVWTIEHRAVPLVSCLALLPVGASADPANRPGLAAVTADMLDEGCGDLTALELHDVLGRIGAQFDTEVGADATVLTVTAIERFAERSVGLLAEMIVRPRLEPADFDRIRELRLNRLLQMRDMPPALAERAFARLLYGDHPYGHLPSGNEESLRAMTVGDVASLHARAYAPNRTTVVVSGDASHDRLAELAEKAFTTWTAADGNRMLDDVSALPIPAASERLAIINRPGAQQSELRIGHVAVPRTTPDYHALVTMNMVLGGQFVSRINMKLREEKGYTYGARTGFEFRLAPGPFSLQASVQSDATADAIHEVFEELHGIRGGRPVTRAELDLGRAALTRGYPRNFETAEQVGRSAAQLALYDLPDDYFSTFVPRVLALHEDDLTAAAERHIDPSRLVTVIVGDRDRVAPTLARLEMGEAIDLTVNSDRGKG